MQENYNTKREALILKEYGRNIQKLIEKVCKIKDKEERTKKTEILIRIMKSVNPKVRGISDDSRKLWDDLFIMSDYKLDIEAPYPMPEKDILKKKVSKMPYKQNPMKYKHYGRNIELLLQKIGEEKDNEVQERLVGDAIRIMRGFNTTWNSDSSNIDGIIEDMKKMIGKEIKVDIEKLKIEAISRPSFRNNRYKTQRSTTHKSNPKWTSS